MRNLKRTLSLVLAALMLMGMMVVGAGAAGVDDFSDKDEIVNKDAVSMLTILGVINGKEDGSYYAPKDNVTRAEMAKMIATILNQGADVNDLYANLETGLTDINNSWAKGYINYCYSLGIIAGRGNGTFDPTAPVTGNEAAKMLLVAIGYDPEIEGLTGASWAIKTTSLASTLGIFDDLTAPTAENLNRDNAALLIYNALDVEMIQKYEDGYAMIFEDHRTLLSNKYGVYKVEGVVTANEWAELNQTNSEAAAKVGKTTLDQVKVYASTTSNTTVGEYVEEKEPVTFNVTTPVDMLGQTVTMYIKKTTVLANSTVLGVTVKDDVNVIEGTVANTTKVADLLKGTGLSVTDDTEYYVNYGYETASKAAELISDYDWGTNGSKFNMNGVDVKLIDNNNDGDVEYVLYVRETLSNVVRTNTKDETVTINVPVVNTNGILTTVNKTSTNTQVLDNADIVTDMDLAAEDLILYVQYGGRTYITEPTIVTGTMTRVDRDQADEQYITVDDGNTYKMSYIREVESYVDADVTRFYIEDAGKSNGAQFETKYDFILDSNGYVIAFRPAEDVVTNYGLVLESAWTQNALTKAGEIKILRADAVEQKYSINWSASDDCFPGGEADLEKYLGTRDVNNTGKDNTLGTAIGTVIEYSVNEDGILTIENVLNLNTLNSNGDLTTASGNQISDISMDVKTNDIAYTGYNKNAETAYGWAANTTPNLQYTLTSKYENGDGYLNVVANAANVNKTFAVDKNTVAFYYVDSKHYGVATGWENMGDVNTGVKAQVYPVITKSGGQYTASTLADVVLFNSELTTNTANYMLVLNANAVDAKNLELNVVFEDGTTAEILVDKSDYSHFNSNSSFMKAYKYGVDGSGKYTINTTDDVISAVPTSLLQNGTVDANGKYLTILGNSNIWDVTDVDSADDTVSTGSFDYVNHKYAVIVDTNSGKTLKTAWVWDMDGDDVYGSNCTFDWNLTNYETVWATGSSYDYMQLAQALSTGKNVRVFGNLNLTYPLTIPAGVTVQVEGNLTTNGVNTVNGAGNLRVNGTYTANTDIVVPTQVVDLKTADNVTIKANTHVYRNATLGDTITAGMRNTIDSGVHFCSKTGTVTANNYLVVNGHYESNNTVINAGGEVNSTNTMIVFGNLTINGGTLTVGNTAAGNLVMASNGTIGGAGALNVNNGTLTLTTGSNVNMSGAFNVQANGTVSQNYAANKVLKAGTIYINGTINVPGNVEANTSLSFGTSAKGSIGGVFKQGNAVVSAPSNITTGTESGQPGVTGLALSSLKVKGQTAVITGTNASVNLTYTMANDTTVNNKFDYEVANGLTGVDVKIYDATGTVTNDKGALAAGTYTINLSKAGYNAVTYTVKVTVSNPGTNADLGSVAVKGQTLTVASGDGKTASTPFVYNANLTYNLGWDTTLTQLSIVAADSKATVNVTSYGTTGITANGTGAVQNGTIEFTIKAEDGTITYHKVVVTVSDAQKVTLAEVSGTHASLTDFVAGGVVSNKEIFLKAAADAGYGDLKVFYQIHANGTVASAEKKDWIELPVNPDGTYTLTTGILAQAEGKTISLKAMAETKLVKVTIDSTSNVMIDGKPVTGAVYFTQNSTVTISVLSGKKVTGNASLTYAGQDGAYDKYTMNVGTADFTLNVQ